MTAGASSGSKRVPDGKTATDLMKNLILGEHSDLTKDDISSWDFNKAAEHFYDLVDTPKRDIFFRDYFQCKSQ